MRAENRRSGIYVAWIVFAGFTWKLLFGFTSKQWPCRVDRQGLQALESVAPWWRPYGPHPSAWLVPGVPSRCLWGALEVLGRCLGGALAVPWRCLKGAWEVPPGCLSLRQGQDSRCLRGAFEVPARCFYPKHAAKKKKRIPAPVVEAMRRRWLVSKPPPAACLAGIAAKHPRSLIGTALRGRPA